MTGDAVGRYTKAPRPFPLHPLVFVTVVVGSDCVRQIRLTLGDIRFYVIISVGNSFCPECARYSSVMALSGDVILAHSAKCDTVIITPESPPSTPVTF